MFALPSAMAQWQVSILVLPHLSGPMADNIQPAKSEPVWHSVYPTPNFDTPRISAADLAELIKGKKAGVDYIVVDVRRTDFEVFDSLKACHSFRSRLTQKTLPLEKPPEYVCEGRIESTGPLVLSNASDHYHSSLEDTFGYISL